MTQAHPVPDVHARGSLAVENVPAGAVALIGSSKGHDQIQLRAGIDDPADAAKNPIHFAKRSESIDVNRLQTGGLRQQFLVGHWKPPHLAGGNHDTGVSDVRSQSCNLTTKSFPRRIVSQRETLVSKVLTDLRQTSACNAQRFAALLQVPPKSPQQIVSA